MNKLKKVEKTSEEKKEEKKSEVFEDYKNEYDKYKSKKESLPKKGAGREQFTLELLAKFKKKLQTAKEVEAEENQEAGDRDDDQSW